MSSLLRRHKVLLLFPLLLAVGLLGFGGVAYAGVVDDTVASALAIIFGFILSVLNAFFGNLLTAFIGLFVQVAQYNDFISQPSIQTAWALIRDLANLAITLALIVIAFAAILRLQAYPARQYLPRLVIVAILVNFSMTIAGFFIDVAQVVMLTFVNAFKDQAPASLTTMLAIFESQSFGQLTDIRSLDVLVAGLLAIAFLLIAVVTIGALLLMLIIRIIMLWILLVFSPIGIVGYAIPMGQRWASQWWSYFGKYVTVGPLLAFFVWLALTVVGQGVNLTNVSGANALLNVQAAVSQAGNPSVIINFIVAIGMLIVGLLLAQQTGGYIGKVAGGAIGLAEGGGRYWGMSVPWTFAKFMGRTADRTQMWAQRNTIGRLAKEYVPLSLRPSVYKKAWEARTAQKEKERYEVPIGAAFDRVNKLFGFKPLKTMMTLWQKDVITGKRRPQLVLEETDEARRALRRRTKEERGGITTRNAEELQRRYLRAKREGKAEQMAAYLQALTEQADLNEILGLLGYKGQNDKRALQQLMREHFAPLVGEQAAFSIGNDISYVAEGLRQTGYARAYTQDIRTGRFEEVSDAAHPGIIRSELSKAEPRAAQRQLNRFSMLDEKDFIDPATGKRRRVSLDFHEAGKAVLGFLEEGALRRRNEDVRFRERGELYNHVDQLRGVNPVAFVKFLQDAYLDPKAFDRLIKISGQRAELDAEGNPVLGPDGMPKLLHAPEKGYEEGRLTYKAIQNLFGSLSKDEYDYLDDTGKEKFDELKTGGPVITEEVKPEVKTVVNQIMQIDPAKLRGMDKTAMEEQLKGLSAQVADLAKSEKGLGTFLEQLQWRFTRIHELLQTKPRDKDHERELDDKIKEHVGQLVKASGVRD